MARQSIIACGLLESTKQSIEDYAEALRNAAPNIGEHGLSEQEFWDSGLFRSAIEKLRGSQAAAMAEKRRFVDDALDYLQATGRIREWRFSGAGERHDYEVRTADGRLCVIETKGCLDGNNTNIYERPNNADEFVIWSLCQNPGSDPAHNAWSGIHTRLSAEIIHRRQKVDALIIWDMLCGTRGRPCPKLVVDPSRATLIGKRLVPPPCIYLFPRTIPDARNNPAPPCHELAELGFAQALHSAFGGDDNDVVEVGIQVRMDGPEVERKTRYRRAGVIIAESNWTKVRRAR